MKDELGRGSSVRLLPSSFCKPAPPASDLSTAAEADRDFSRFDNYRYLTTTVRILKHVLETFVIFQNVDVFEGYFAPGVIRTGSRCVGSKIFAKDKDRIGTHSVGGPLLRRNFFNDKCREVKLQASCYLC
jgi:hypothetical protein